MAVAIRQLQAASAPSDGPVASGIPQALRRQLPALEMAMRGAAVPAATRVGAMASYHLGWTEADGRARGAGGGKLLRGCLALWAAERCGSAEAALPVAAAVEWIHNFTLVHDDIQDGDRERRHRPTVWAVFGAAQAINAGDGMHAVAYRALLGGRDRPQARLRAAVAVNNAILEVIEGQCLDLALEGQIDTTAATYLRLARAKTGALIGAALEAGSLIVGADPRRATQLRRAGIELGVAFQIRDDWLGIWGDAEVTGKGCGGDIARRKLTYPVVIGLSRLRGTARREFRRLYARSSGDEDRILALLDESGTPEAVSFELRRRGRSALQLVEACGFTPDATDEFAEIVDFITERAA